MRLFVVFILFLSITNCVPKAEKDQLLNILIRSSYREILKPILQPTNTVPVTTEPSTPAQPMPEYILQNVPTQMIIPIPRSIRKQDTSSSFLIRQTTSQYGLGYLSFSDSIDKVTELLSDSRRDQILLDHTFTYAKERPNQCIPGNTIQIEFTKEKLNKIKEAFLNYGMSEEEADSTVTKLQNSYKLPKEGEKIPNPAVLFTVGEYQNQLDYTVGERVSDIVSCPSDSKFKKKLSFSDNKEKLSYQFTYITKNLDSTISINSTLTYTNSSTENKLYMDIDTIQVQDNKSTRFSNSFIMEGCRKPAPTGCILIRSISQIVYPKNPLLINSIDSTLVDSDNTTLVEGRLDGNGGFLSSTFIKGIGGKGTGMNKTKYKELFNGKGILSNYEVFNDTSQAYEPYNNLPSIPTDHIYKDYPLSEILNSKAKEEDISVIPVQYNASPTNVITNALGGSEELIDYFVISKENCNPNISLSCITGKGKWYNAGHLIAVSTPSIEDFYSILDYYSIPVFANRNSIWKLSCCNSQWNLVYTKLINRVGIKKSVSLVDSTSLVNKIKGSNTNFILTKKGCEPNLVLFDCMVGSGRFVDNDGNNSVTFDPASVYNQEVSIEYRDFGIINGIPEIEVWEVIGTYPIYTGFKKLEDKIKE